MTNICLPSPKVAFLKRNNKIHSLFDKLKYIFGGKEPFPLITRFFFNTLVYSYWIYDFKRCGSETPECFLRRRLLKLRDGGGELLTCMNTYKICQKGYIFYKYIYFDEATVSPLPPLSLSCC